MQVFFGIAYFVIGLVQLFAIVDGIGYALSVGKVISFIVALLITYIPLLGSIVGVYGAVNVWDWSIWQAGVLFFWYVPVFIIMMAAGYIFDRR